MTETSHGEFRLRCARAASWHGLWQAMRWWAGVAFLGFVISAIGWMNLVAAAIHGDDLAFPARPYEWFFAAGGVAIILLSLSMEVGPWLPARHGRPVKLHADGVTYAGRVTVPWACFERLEVIAHDGGRHELTGTVHDDAALPSHLRPYLVTDDVLSLGDLDDRPGVLDAIRRWRDPVDSGGA